MLYLFIEDCKQPEGYKVGLLLNVSSLVAIFMTKTYVDTSDHK